MSSNRFVFQGLDELREELRQLPTELAGEASSIVLDAGEQAATTVRAIYDQHIVTGHLAKSVTVGTQAAGQYGAGAIVRVNDALAWLFDNGSQARHKVKGSSTGQMWGRTPPTHAFSGTMARGRRQMYSTLRGLLETHGLIVSGDA